jgi:hypothetical protein
MCIGSFNYVSLNINTSSYLSVRGQRSQSPKGTDKITVQYILYFYLFY